MPGASTFHYANNQLLIVRQGTLLTQSFDPERRALTGEPVAVAEQIAGGGQVGTSSAFSISGNGVLVYQTGVGGSADTELVWMDRTGKRLNLVGVRRPGTVPRRPASHRDDARRGRNRP
jgi:hypothetical protein